VEHVSKYGPEPVPDVGGSPTSGEAMKNRIPAATHGTAVRVRPADGVQADIGGVYVMDCSEPGAASLQEQAPGLHGTPHQSPVRVGESLFYPHLPRQEEGQENGVGVVYQSSPYDPFLRWYVGLNLPKQRVM
jgi:hypothetical protein